MVKCLKNDKIVHGGSDGGGDGSCGADDAGVKLCVYKLLKRRLP